MDRILIILKTNGPRASSAPALGLNTIIFKHVYWHMLQISGERLQDHWSSGFNFRFDSIIVTTLLIGKRPIFKKGDRITPSNYRPISLTADCCKVMEHILHSQVMQYLDLHNILSDLQHGFRKKKNARESQLILTIQDLASSLDDGEQIDTVLLDFSKALCHTSTFC